MSAPVAARCGCLCLLLASATACQFDWAGQRERARVTRAHGERDASAADAAVDAQPASDAARQHDARASMHEDGAAQDAGMQDAGSCGATCGQSCESNQDCDDPALARCGADDVCVSCESKSDCAEFEARDVCASGVCVQCSSESHCASDQNCSLGMCCNEGTANCNGELDDGCEVDLGRSPAHCGACGNACDWDCVDSTCDGIARLTRNHVISARGRLRNVPAYGNDASPAMTDQAGEVLDVLQVGGMYYHTCALLADHRVVCWGKNDAGQLGNGSADAFSATPVVVGGGTVLTGVTQLVAGWRHTCALVGYGVRCWGGNTSSALGVAPTAPTYQAKSALPVSVVGTSGSGALSLVSRVVAGDFFSCAEDSTGLGDSEFLCWGNKPGLVATVAGSEHVPRYVVDANAAHVKGSGLVVGSEHACFIGASSIASCWGTNMYGGLGACAVRAVGRRFSTSLNSAADSDQ